MAKSKFKMQRLRFLSVSMVVTSMILILLQGALYLHGSKIITLPNMAVKAINSISLVIAILFFISLLLRLTIKRVYNLFDEPEEKIFYSKIYTWLLYSIGLFIILYRFGVSLGNITIFVGLIATGLAFAIRDVLMSFFGWMILLRKKPFRIGDYIRIGDDEGKVLHIGTFFVLIDNTHDLPEDYTRVPNRLFLEKSIIILGKNKYHDQLTLQLTGLPANLQQIITDLKTDMHSSENIDDPIDIHIDIKNDKLMLIIEYLVGFERRREVRMEVIGLAFKRLYAFIHVPKV